MSEKIGILAGLDLAVALALLLPLDGPRGMVVGLLMGLSLTAFGYLLARAGVR